MKLENAIIKKLFFDMYGQRKYFSGDIEVPPYSMSIPQTAFLHGGEEIIRDKIHQVFNIVDFSIDKQLNFQTCSISDRQSIWGFIGNSGQIFSLSSLLFKEEQLNTQIQDDLKLFNIEHSLIKDKISFEDKVNFVVSQKLESTNSNLDWYKKTQSFYSSLILTIELDCGVNNQLNQKQKLKI